ncbi:murein transglycosylase A [Erythrobacter sp. HL-111]|uniref:murein transglycosylase A n=1 Tax=Erythrobacter sp. HL-111 TaxID=1798193 RepID=UPI0006D9BDC7|nr:murein transglycosylase A [Erythrobacter sp. HL-111]KPP94328.1 MAG: membrane-bound lytic murein transglycosylase MltA [Erythrobacteraceae bacterium HL-111]SDS50857.1 membrane-bound lytic murein transglycosylase A [Erythrobacter sp. HL-111]
MRVPVAIGAACGLSLVLAACAAIPPSAPPPAVSGPPPAPTPASAFLAGVEPGPPVGALGLSPPNARAALASFRESCPRLLGREDASGLAQGADWRAACSAAATWPGTRASDFFAAHFETARIGAGEAFATGYYEPEILGSRTRRPGFEVPVYAMPGDLVREWPADLPPSEREGPPPLGRRDASGAFVPYYSRAEIEDGALEGRAPVIAWAADPVEFFFLQIQGSGRLVTPEGEVIRIGYAGQNGRGYTSIGAVMRERGLLGEGPGQYPGSMQGIMAYLRENPDEGRALMRLNESWIFFRELNGDGPLGALGVPVRPRASVAADPRFVPLGAPVWLDLDRDEADGLWIAQDSGGAIKGANRFDTFWGAGEEARAIAGTMSGRGEAFVLLPAGTLDRLAQRR